MPLPRWVPVQLQYALLKRTALITLFMVQCMTLSLTSSSYSMPLMLPAFHCWTSFSIDWLFGINPCYGMITSVNAGNLFRCHLTSFSISSITLTPSVTSVLEANSTKWLEVAFVQWPFNPKWCKDRLKSVQSNISTLPLVHCSFPTAIFVNLNWKTYETSSPTYKIPLPFLQTHLYPSWWPKALMSPSIQL